MNEIANMGPSAFEDATAMVAGVLASAQELYEEGDREDAEGTIIEAAWALESFADMVGGRPPRDDGNGLFP